MAVTADSLPHAAAVVDQGVALPGVTGEAATAARFAGCWTERAKTGATPDAGQRIYEVDTVVDAPPAPGGPRRATAADRDLLVSWFRAFQVEIGDTARETHQSVDRRISAGQLWFWHDGAPVATALVAAVSRAVRSRGDRCILYTDLSNPTSNSIYRAIGYRAVAEVLRYRFDAPDG